MVLPFPLRSAAACAFDVVGLGQNSVDHVFRVKQVPTAGSKTEALDYQLLTGGQVATTMLTARRLGLRAQYMGAIGDDAMGDLVCQMLQENGVQLILTIVPDARTQFSMVLVDQYGERTIVEHYDPRTVVTPEKLQRDLICAARVLHLDITDVPAALQAAHWAREAGMLVSLDIDRLLPGTEELLRLVDLLVAAEGLPQELGSPDPRLALFTLREHCPGFICITQGERGCVALDGAEALWVPAFQVEVMDTTGCGDVFRGALIYSVLQGWPMARSLRFASAAAALQAGTLGAQGGVPSLVEVERFLTRAPPLRNKGRNP